MAAKLNKLLPLVGMVGVCTLWFGVLYGMLQTGLGLLDTRPISFIGAQPGVDTIFNASLFVSAVLFFAFGLILHKRYHPPRSFLVLYCIGQVAQIIVALFIYEGSEKVVHTAAAFILAGSIPLYMRQFLRADLPYGLRRRLATLYGIEKAAFVVGIGSFIFLTGVSPLAEILPALPFHAWIAVLTWQIVTQTSKTTK